ncbi:PD40 domain-containing protein [Trichocoleus sp. FACHB-90]|uniref:nSTAND1 domain-containing NTPase n=1 Tax=Cyanophyceae TaxID=3028117 RepID=UPI00168928D1|nr:CHAT domain-containing protein [Trichocoleus sp. FACHB-90]MBD1929925.1 PD40 domain-containing protein [Trichocoleus sp. FACHB-90]
MRKLVVLKLDGDLEQGVQVTLEIGAEGERPNTETIGQLPPAIDLVKAIDQWQSAYRSIGKSSRIKAKKIVYGGSLTEWRSDCENCAIELRKHLNNWLVSESFRPIREKCLQQLSPSEEVRVLIRSSSVQLRKLPWHLWDLVEENLLAEIAYSAPESKQLAQSASSKTPTYRDKVRILAILGNSAGINVQKDRQLLESLPDAVTTFLVEPQRQDINDHLWNQPWDILFFAGHSNSEGDTGRIYINQTDSLTITELSYALRNAVANGLQLAIFNSCDGLGLAFELEQLHIGQMIVMREPVPDEVAQAFLTDFLAAFATDKSFYLAQREARLKLQGLENNFPCASWLPAIFQNPAVVPPMWQDLGRRPTKVCPYRGLFAFREEDAPFFYGRDAFTKMLVEAVQQQSLVAVIGPSGSGKSSVVFAGLIPQLRSEQSWLIEAFRPGDRPFRNLATKLVPLLETQMSETDKLLEINKQTIALQQGDLALRDVIARILEKNLGDRLLLVVDQFEELYTLCRDARERLLFLDSLLEAVERTPNFTLVLTLRADFLGQALSYRPFGDALQYADLKLSSMNREELLAAVEQPAAMLGVTIESGLTQRILDAVSTQPGDLPLLEFALNQLWAKQRDAQLTHAAYEEIGGVEAALSRYAEEAYGRLNEEEKERARRIFIQLVRPGEGTEDTRRLATRTEVGEENWDLVTRLADARLVVSSRDEALGEETVEIVHEALIRGWKHLSQWIELDRAFRTWQERLRASLRQWEASGKDEGALLRGVPLAEAEGWLVSRAVELSPTERVFIQISLELRDRERKEQERRRQRTIMGLVGGLGVVSILAVGAFWQWQQANTERMRAEIGRTNAELNSLSERSQALFNAGNRSEALIESLRAGLLLKWSTWETQADTRTQVVATLQQVVYGLRELRILKGYSGGNTSFSPDGKTIASASEDKTVKLWSIDGTELHTFKGHSSKVTSVSFSPDGKTIASASEDKTVKLWSTDSTELHTFKGHSGGVTSVSFSPDGKTIASASSDGSVKLWSIDGTELHSLKGQSGGVTSVCFSPDGKTITFVSGGKTVKRWSIESREFVLIPDGEGVIPEAKEGVIPGGKEGEAYLLISVSFSPDGETIAFASEDKTVKVWSKDDSLFSTSTRDITIPIWRADNNVVKYTYTTYERREAPSDDIPSIGDISSMGDSGIDTKIEWYSTKLDIKGHSGAVTSVSFSPDGKTIVSASEDKTVKLWSMSIVGEQLHTLKGHSGSVTSVSFSPDGKTIASASSDGTIILWNFDLEDLLVHGCDWLRAQKTNPNITESDKWLCEHIGTQK